MPLCLAGGMSKLSDLIEAHQRRFGEGSPIFGIPEEEAIASMEATLRTGKPIVHGAEKGIPPGAFL